MLIRKERLIGAPIMSLQTGTELAHADSAIIDPRNLTIVGFYCSGPGVEASPAILHTSDIREFGELGLIVDSADVLMPPDDLVRLQEILDFHFELENKQVVEDTGSKVGKVISYTLDSELFYIIKLHVRPTLLKAFQTAEILIDRSQISEITDQKIVVKSAVVRDKPVTKAPHVIHNPFRKTDPHPQPDTITQDR